MTIEQEQRPEALLEEEEVSKSEIKRQMLELQKLAERLMNLKTAEWEKLSLSERLMEALSESLRIKSQNARRRHVRRVARLLTDTDTDQVRELFERIDNRHIQSVAAFHHLERWRDRLVAEGDAALNKLLDEYPNADRQQFRQLIRMAKKEQVQGKSPASQRKIFKLLREISGN